MESGINNCCIGKMNLILTNIRNILSLNERFIYNAANTIRMIVLPFFDYNLKLQRNNTYKKIENKIGDISGQLKKYCPLLIRSN